MSLFSNVIIKCLLFLISWLVETPSNDYPCVFSDIDECLINPNICGAGNTCTNSEGGFYCNCGSGYDSSVDRRSCIGETLLTLL